MMTLYNKEQVVSAFLYQERQDAKAEGIELGREEGIELGMEKGRAEGRAEAREEEKKAFVFNLHSMGMDEDFISRAAKISVDAVRKLLGMMPT